MAQLVKKIKINTTIELLTGLHIGGNKDNVEIGGIDLPVIKLATKKNQPYIPGSSLKGKMRCLLEQEEGASEVGGSACVNRLFGVTENKKRGVKNQPSRLIVRDAELTPEWQEKLEEREGLDMPYTENKFENTVSRLSGTAKNPRQIERVPAGAVFNVEFIINVWNATESDEDIPTEEELLTLFKRGVSLLENDYLGGSGSRGYGQIRFGEFDGTAYVYGKEWKVIPGVKL